MYEVTTYHKVGTFTGSSLVKDPETGMLETPKVKIHTSQLKNGNYGTGPISVFPVELKLLFLNNLHDCYPNLAKAGAMVGISRYTLNNHLAVDNVLRECVEEIKLKKIDKIHEVRMQVAETKSGSFDRMAVLNAHMPELYNPSTKIEIEHTGLTKEEAVKRDAMLSGVIDAEVIATVKQAKKLKTGNAL